MNTENSKISDPHTFKLDLTGKLNLKNKKKHGFSQFKNLLHLGKHQNPTTINLKFLSQLRMELLIYLIVLIRLMIFKIILNL